MLNRIVLPITIPVLLYMYIKNIVSIQWTYNVHPLLDQNDVIEIQMIWAPLLLYDFNEYYPLDEHNWTVVNFTTDFFSYEVEFSKNRFLDKTEYKDSKKVENKIHWYPFSERLWKTSV